MPIKPSNRFVAFIDILGVSQLLADEGSSSKFTSILYDLLFTVLKKEGFHELQNIHDSRIVEFELTRPYDKRVRLTALSDAIVLSIPESSNGKKKHRNSRLVQILSIVETISNLQSSLASIGVLSRGGLSYGPILHTRDIVVGSGLVKAHELESKLAIWPRTLVDKMVIEMLLRDEIPSDIMGFRSRIAHAISVDTDGEYFVDYFGFRPLFGGILRQQENF